MKQNTKTNKKIAIFYNLLAPVVLSVFPVVVVVFDPVVVVVSLSVVVPVVVALF